MTPDDLWKRYSAIWSLPDADERSNELSICLADEATYCDPNGLLVGRDALSGYMAQFQSSVPGGRFHIRSVLHHHDRSLAQWFLAGDDGSVLQTGTSFGAIGEDGRLLEISGFFHPSTAA
ncbi:MAG: nuclear transport factor 2 family protein [Candidatus Eremiobacteraeota bacterium]|nr:nuclear transport factor 2 family protein [Candidatus Eremiobacteraeota bacterium]